MATERQQVDHFEVLGISRSSSPGTIRRAYRQKALATHPDKGGTAESFRRVVRAFEALGALKVVERERRDSTCVSSKSHSKENPSEEPSRHKQDCRRRRLNEGDGDRKVKANITRKEMLNIRLFQGLERLRKSIEALPKEVRQVQLGKMDADLKSVLLSHMQRAPTVENRALVVQHWSQSSEEESLSQSSSAGSDSDRDGENSEPLWEICESYAPQHVEEQPVSSQEPLPPDVFRNPSGPAVQSKGRSGITGISCMREMDATVYRAKIRSHNILMTCRRRHTLDDAISDHMLLVQLRDAFRVVLSKFDGNTDGCIDRSDDIAHNLELALEEVFSENGVSNAVQGLCSFSGRLSQPYIRGELEMPPTRSIAKCIRQRHKLVVARGLGWEAFREEWVHMTQIEEQRICGTRGNAKCTPDSVRATLDEAYKQHEAQRLRSAERVQEYVERRRVKMQLKESKRIERRIKAYEKLCCKSSKALKQWNQFCKMEQLQASKRELRKQADVKRLQAQERSRAAKERLQWYRRQDLTMEEIMRGPPS